jgi:aspartyl-tRNA(Asn)/glutamyl-tRNA(Gln) amidotransferase subunit C
VIKQEYLRHKCLRNGEKCEKAVNYSFFTQIFCGAGTTKYLLSQDGYEIRPRILRRITPAEWRGNMANVISDETIEYVGILAKLELSDEEKEAAKKDMASMLDHIDKLNELDTTGVEPMSHVFPVENVMREDVVTNGDGSEATLANAPERKEDAFVVPKTVD